MPAVDPENLATVRKILRRKMAAIPGEKTAEIPYYSDEPLSVKDVAVAEQRAIEEGQKKVAREVGTKFAPRAQFEEGSDISNEELAAIARRNLGEQRRLMDLLVAKEFAKTIPEELQGLPGLGPDKIEDVVKLPEGEGIQDNPEVTFAQALAQEYEKKRKKRP